MLSLVFFLQLHYSLSSLKKWSFSSLRSLYPLSPLSGPLSHGSSYSLEPWKCHTPREVFPDPSDQSWVFIGRTDVEAETPVLWPPDAKSWLIGKDSDAGKDWGQEEKGTTEDEMASLTQWIWVWVNSGSWWWTGRPGVLQFMGSQRVGHDWATELNYVQ